MAVFYLTSTVIITKLGYTLFFRENCHRLVKGIDMRPLESLFIFAFIFYSTAIWSHRFHGKMKTWMLACFGAGLLADISGTIFLCVIVSDSWQWTLHSISGLAALLIMGVHFIWALLAITRGGASEKRFNRWSLMAWVIWIIAFVSGIPM